MLYLKYLKMNLRSFLQYRLNTFLAVLAQFLSSAVAFAGVYLLFDRFGSLGGWSLGEVSLCFAVTLSAFAITDCVARGFDVFSGSVKSGDFDRILLRPRGTVLQVMGSHFELSRLGRLLEALLVLVLAVRWLGLAWDFPKALTLLLMLLGGACTFTGIYILGAAVCFFTVEGLEFLNIFTHGGRELASYPLTIFNRWLRRFFTFIVPFGCMNYLPLLYLTGRAEQHAALYMLTPLLGVAFLFPCVLVWRMGVKRYLSTGN
ncbi:MAG: ABC-2 family transporter protein [Oscillospiraceae bacterium]|jgi:ABC-2 type transport system permease protein|nr:ABC-2 family transporter protein [Oscillospiraceae bacterium]